ncbi:hypothetical protein G9A89_015956 [Geosiphon pyriformis]|nr:hypothetical protein G9A89_015956 [Geosiphon pyriformis]
MSRLWTEKSLLFSESSQTPKDFVTRVLSPRVAVVSSADADAVCRTSNFPTFLDLIKPFGERIEGKVTVRDSQNLPNPIEGFAVRFADLAHLEQPNTQLTSKLLADKVKQYAKDTNLLNDHQPIASKTDVTERYLKAIKYEITPWYAEYCRLFFTLNGVSEHESFEHPVACIIAISTSNPDPINTLNQLFNANTPAPIYEKGFMDPNILKYYVLLHDDHKVSLEHSKAVYEKTKRTFGLHCHLIKLNSILPTTPLDNDDPFSVSSSAVLIRSTNPDIWTSSINESNLLQSLISSSVSPSNLESRHRHNTVPSNETYSLPLSPTASTLDSPTSSYNEDIQFGKDRENLVFESQNSMGFGLVGDLPPPVVLYGQYLSEEDFQGIQVFLRELVVQSIVPYMERNVQLWNEQVASSRRGFTGKLFSASRRYFGTGSKSSGQIQPYQASSVEKHGAQNSFNVLYPHTAPEAQMRRLADFAFMLRDYRFAYSVYDTVKKDFQADKAWKYYAGAQEMMGLCLLLSPSPIGNKVDVDHYFEQAVNAFSNRAKALFFATKATILYYEMLKYRNLYKDAPTALVRISGEDSDLRSALFLEQAAHAFLRGPRPLVRKYAFHLILAGHRYGKCNQREHAYRCYLAASHVFENRSWLLVEDHINFTLGRQSFHMDDLDHALHFFLKLLRESRQPTSQQTAYLREFLYIYKHCLNKSGKEAIFNPLDLPIPVINDSSVRVVLSNSHSNEYDETWHAMEQELIEDYKGMDIYSKTKKRLFPTSKENPEIVCAVGEPFFVQLDLYNPMQIQISVTDLILECEYESLPNLSENLSHRVDELEGATQIQESRFNSHEAFELETISEIPLEGSEKRKLSLRVTPKKEGMIKILGIHYSLNSVVPGLRKFSKKGKRLNETKEHRMNTLYAHDRSLELLITSPMPLLEVAFHSFPEMLLSGEVTPVVLEVNNKGQTGMTDLQVKMSHPSFFCVGNSEMLEKTVYDSELDVVESPNSEIFTEKLIIRNQLFNSSIMNIPLPPRENTDANKPLFMLAPGKTTLIPIWIRGDRIGKHMFRFLFTYQSEDENAAMKYRSLRYFVTTQVLPSLKINAFTRPSTSGLNEFILGIEAENLQHSADFQLTQISSISPAWSISPINMINGDNHNSKLLIAPRQTIFTYYRISKLENIHNVDGLKPEQFSKKALQRILSGNDTSKVEPSPIELVVTNLPFTKRIITNISKPLEGFSVNSRVQWRINTLINQFPAVSPKLHQEIFTLYTTNDVDLSLYWNIPNLQRQGHHYIIGINLGLQQNPFQVKDLLSITPPNRALFEQTFRERTLLINSLLKNKHFKDESPLKLSLKCADIHHHDFWTKCLCVLPIIILIKNCSWSKHVNFNLELLSFDENALVRSVSQKSLHTNIFHWTGTTYKYGLLSPKEEFKIVAKACFTQPGIYDLNRWRLTVDLDATGTSEGSLISNTEGKKVGYVQMPNTPHLLTLLDSNAPE